MNYIYLPWDSAIDLIKEGDVLLFRTKSLISFFIQRFTQSPYSHVGLASWHNGGGILEILEFHLQTGGVARNLETISKNNPKIIDIYRPISSRFEQSYDLDQYKIVTKEIAYNGKTVTNSMRKLTALPYSLAKIGLCLRGYAAILRFFTNFKKSTDDTPKPSTTHICSSAVAYCMNINEYDLVKNTTDIRTTPGSLSRSPLLNYLFTIE